MFSSNFGSYTTTTHLGVSLASITLIYGIYKISTFIYYDEVTSQFQHLPEPPSPAPMQGNWKQHQDSINPMLMEDWTNQYGTTIKLKRALGATHLPTTDAKTTNYILFNSYGYRKLEHISYSVSRIFENGIRQDPAFGPQQLWEQTRIFVEMTLELGDIWIMEKHEGEGPIKYLPWTCQAMLDIIRLAVMNPSLRFLPTQRDVETKAFAVMNCIKIELFNRLLQANINQNMLAQISTFTFCGHETSMVTIWSLYVTAQNKYIQTKLRREKSNVSADNPTMDDLNGLPYLDTVVSETLRLDAPVPDLRRAARKEDCISLRNPLTNKQENVYNGTRVENCQQILIPILIISRDNLIWREDSTKFGSGNCPNILDTAASVPGFWANIVSVFSLIFHQILIYFACK